MLVLGIAMIKLDYKELIEVIVRTGLPSNIHSLNKIIKAMGI